MNMNNIDWIQIAVWASLWGFNSWIWCSCGKSIGRRAAYEEIDEIQRTIMFCKQYADKG